MGCGEDKDREGGRGGRREWEGGCGVQRRICTSTPPSPIAIFKNKNKAGSAHHTTPHHTISHHTTPHHITPHHTISHHTTPHHTISHHTISHHTTPHHTISHCTIITHPPEYPSHMISSSTKQHMVTAPSDSNRRDRARGTGRSGVG